MKITRLNFIFYTLSRLTIAGMFFMCFFPSVVLSKKNSNVKLEVVIKDKVVSEQDLNVINLGETIQLQVIKKHSGRSEDVTSDNKIYYQVLTPWSLKINQTGLVEGIYPDSSTASLIQLSSNHGQIHISYGNAGDDEVGSVFLNFFVDFSGRSESSSMGNKVSQNSLINEDSETKPDESRAVDAVPAIIDNVLPESIHGQIPDDVLEIFKNLGVQEMHSSQTAEQNSLKTEEQLNNENQSNSENQFDTENVDFIDYDKLKILDKDLNPLPQDAPSPNPAFELTPEERRLYEDALKAP